MVAEALVPKLGRVAANAPSADVGKRPISERARGVEALAQMVVTGPTQEERNLVENVDYSGFITEQ